MTSSSSSSSSKITTLLRGLSLVANNHKKCTIIGQLDNGQPAAIVDGQGYCREENEWKPSDNAVIIVEKAGLVRREIADGLLQELNEWKAKVDELQNQLTELRQGQQKVIVDKLDSITGNLNTLVNQFQETGISESTP